MFRGAIDKEREREREREREKKRERETKEGKKERGHVSSLLSRQ